MKQITKDILDIEYGVICQAVNARGVMGAGLALQVRSKWPVVYASYRKAIDKGRIRLGGFQVVKVAENIWVANLVTQYDYGRDRIQTDYPAVSSALHKLAYFTRDMPYPVYLPYRLACGLGGGDWQTVLGIISLVMPDAIICRKPG